MISEAELIDMQKRAFGAIESVNIVWKTYDSLRATSQQRKESVEELIKLVAHVSDDVDALAECIAHLQRKLKPERAMTAGANPIPEEDRLA